MKDYNTELRANLVRRIAKRGWSVNELARRAGLRQSTVNGIVNGDAGATYARAMLLLDTLKGKRINPETDAA